MSKYRVLSVLGTQDNEATAKAIEAALNKLEEEGFSPVKPSDWVRNGHHWLIAGERSES